MPRRKVIVRKTLVTPIRVTDGITFVELEATIGVTKVSKRSSPKKGDLDTYYDKLNKFMDKTWEL